MDNKNKKQDKKYGKITYKMQLTNSRKSPNLQERGLGSVFESNRASSPDLDMQQISPFASDKFLSDIDYMLSKCDSVQSSVQKTKRLWEKSKSFRKDLMPELAKTPNEDEKKTSEIRKSQTLKQVASKNLLTSPHKLTFECMNSEQAMDYLIRNKRGFGKKISEKISHQDEEIDRKKKVFIEKASLDPMFRFPSEFFNDNYIKNFNYEDFKNAIESNRNIKDIKQMKGKHIRIEKKYKSDK